VSKIVGEDDRGLVGIEIYVYGDDAEALRRATPEGQEAAHFCRDLLAACAKGKSEVRGEYEIPVCVAPCADGDLYLEVRLCQLRMSYVGSEAGIELD